MAKALTMLVRDMVLAADFKTRRERTPPPGPIPREAITYLKQKDLTPRFSFRDVWREEHAVAFTVAKVLEADILASVQRSLQDALAKGTPFDAWRREISDTLRKSGWADYGTEAQIPRRLLTIFETNMRVARAVGQWDRIQRTKRALPYLVYQLGPSERHREAHVALAGTIKRVDDPFWQTAMPPNGWRCRCHVRQISAREAGKLGGETDDADIPRDKDGNVEGIDDAWNYNPGAAGRERLERITEGAGKV